jgi:hypothetical protein
MSLTKQILYCHTLQHTGGTGFEIDGVREFYELLGRHHPGFTVSPDRHTGISNPVTGRHDGYAIADSFDDTSRFHSEHCRQGRELVEARTLIGIDVVEPAGLVDDAGLTRTGFSDIDVIENQILRTTVFVDSYCLDHEIPPLIKFVLIAGLN